MGLAKLRHCPDGMAIRIGALKVSLSVSITGIRLHIPLRRLVKEQLDRTIRPSRQLLAYVDQYS